jgi:hypothetical protein
LKRSKGGVRPVDILPKSAGGDKGIIFVTIDIFEAFEELSELLDESASLYRRFHAEVSDEGLRRFLAAAVETKEVELREVKEMLNDMRIARAFRALFGAEIDREDYAFEPSITNPQSTADRLGHVFELEKLFARIYTDLAENAQGELRQELGHFRDRALRQAGLAENLQDLHALRG